MFEMSDRILILSSKVNFKSDVPAQLLTDWNNDYFAITGNEAEVSTVDWIEKTHFEESMSAVRTFGKRIKNRVKGEILVFLRSETEEVRTGKYKISSSKITFEECDLNISVRKSNKEKGKSLTEEEKIELFREYWNEKHKEPAKNEVFKNFRIGTFYATAMKNNAIAETLRQITTGA